MQKELIKAASREYFELYDTKVREFLSIYGIQSGEPIPLSENASRLASLNKYANLQQTTFRVSGMNHINYFTLQDWDTNIYWARVNCIACGDEMGTEIEKGLIGLLGKEAVKDAPEAGSSE